MSIINTHFVLTSFCKSVVSNFLFESFELPSRSCPDLSRLASSFYRNRAAIPVLGFRKRTPKINNVFEISYSKSKRPCNIVCDIEFFLAFRNSAIPNFAIDTVEIDTLRKYRGHPWFYLTWQSVYTCIWNWLTLVLVGSCHLPMNRRPAKSSRQTTFCTSCSR